MENLSNEMKEIEMLREIVGEQQNKIQNFEKLKTHCKELIFCISENDNENIIAATTKIQFFLITNQ